MASLLEGESLTMRFGGLVAMAEVSFTLKRGEILGIIGPNGAGKSTLFNLITGLYRPSSGEIRLEGQRLAGIPTHKIVARGIARTFQSSRLFGDLSVVDNVVIGRHTHTRCGVVDAIFRRRKAQRELADPTPSPRICCVRYRAASTTSAIVRRPNSRRPTAAASRSHGRWRAGRRCFSSTSHPPEWTMPTPTPSSPISARSARPVPTSP